MEGGRSIIALRKGRRRRHRCRSVINGRGRRGSARVSVFSLQETKSAPYRHPMIKTLPGQLLSCGMFMAAEANFGGLAEEEEGSVGRNLESRIRFSACVYIRRRRCQQCGRARDSFSFFSVPLPHPFCDCARTFSTGNCQIECRAPRAATAGDLVGRDHGVEVKAGRRGNTHWKEYYGCRSTKLAKCDTQRRG